MPDPTESGPELLERLDMDAAKWCAEMHKRGIVTADPAPGEMFHAWMCNAIMTAYDRGHSAAERKMCNDLALFDRKASWAERLRSLRALRSRAWWRCLDRKITT